jgi:hypothetical protein
MKTGVFFRIIGKSGPSIAMAGAILLLFIAALGIGGATLTTLGPWVLLLLLVGVFLSILWATVFVLTRRR